eukprot:TRINITY_DN11746_c0_g1_i1.p1 TRINITY_DN11746_c0_g1~~TRINITY_DN11746_c0_g1_i1.p1  ORF type:complete len:562 (-),score=165.58 TRINITY_DN11746_c0_g1_i1:273-1958(-)
MAEEEEEVPQEEIEEGAVEEEEMLEEDAEAPLDEEAPLEEATMEDEEVMDEEAPPEDGAEEEAPAEEEDGEVAEEEEGEVQWQHPPIEPLQDKFVVRLRQKLGTARHCEAFVDELQRHIETLIEEGKTPVIFEDFDISQNNIPGGLISDIMVALMNENVHVERLRCFGLPTLDDEAAGMVGSWLGQVTEKTMPIELHLSDSAITKVGFESIMQAIIENESIPGVDQRFPHRGPLPIYLRIEYNYIDPEYIQSLVDEGVCVIATKKDPVRMKDGLKCRLITQTGRKCEQNEGDPPPPEEAPGPKRVKDWKGGSKGKSDKGKGKGKDRDKGKGKDRDRGKGYGKDRDAGKGKDRDRSHGKGSKGDEKGGRREKGGRAPLREPVVGGKGDGKRYKGSMADRPRTPPRGRSGKGGDSGRAAPWAQALPGPGPTSARAPSRAVDSRPPLQGRGPSSVSNGKGGSSKGSSKGDFRGSKPFDAFGSRGSAARPAPSAQSKRRNEDDRHEDSKRARADDRRPAKGGGGKGGGKGSDKLPAPWEAHWSTEHNLYYYWNSKTGEAVWEKPT